MPKTLLRVVCSWGVVGALLGGCHKGPAEHRTASTTTPAAARSSSCLVALDCHFELAADVDGDGVPDQVAVIAHLAQDQDQAFLWPDGVEPILRVSIGSQDLTYKVPVEGPVSGHLVRGAAQLDGVPGNELLLGDADGAHGSRQTVLTLRDGQLVPLPAPDPWDPANPSPVGSWGADGSIRSNLGWHCLAGGRVERFSAEGIDKPGGGVDYTISHRTWRWTKLGWTPTTKEITEAHRPAPELSTLYVDWTGCGSFAKYREF